MSDLALQLARRFQPRQVLVVLAAVLVSFLVLDFIDAQGFESMRFFDLNDSDITYRIGFSALAIGGLMLGAAALAFAAAAKADPATRTAFWFKAGGAAFLVLGFEEILGVHTWLDGEGVSWNVSYLPLLAVGTLVWFEMAPPIDTPGARRRVAVAIAAFLASCLFDAARAGDGHAYALGEALEMVAAAMFLVSMVVHAHALPAPEGEEQGRRGNLAAIAALAQRLDPVKLAIGAGVTVVILGVMGTVSHSVDYMRVFDVNKEQNYASVFSGLALWAAALMAVCNGLFRYETRHARRWWLALAFVFLYLGLDEMTALHEEAQHVTGIWGQTFLAPVVLVGVAAWYMAIKEMNASPLAVTLWIAGAAAWVCSQGIDLVLNDPMPWTTVPEELGEMTGSLLFAFSLLLALRPLAAASFPALRHATAAPVPAQELQPAQ
jgi:hypothetical protein